MKRDIETELVAWINHPLRKPLILRGARQVGKSWLAKSLANHFEHFIEINFDKDKSAALLFEGDVNIAQLLERIEIYKKVQIIPGKTLIFLDEIQECEAAFKTLRYFKEEMPELHVIAAGSLLDFTIEKIGVPVGRVQFMYIHPLNFGEYLTAMGESKLRGHISCSPIHEVFHQQLLMHLKYYFWLGGLPAVVLAWRDHKRADYCQQVQDEIIQAYRDDFEKYARKNQIFSVEKIFSAIPLFIGQKFKYASVDPESRSTILKDALLKLQNAGIAHITYHSSGQGLPLAATQDDKRFKVYFFDIGLAQRMLRLNLSDWLLTPLEVRHMGAICEQFVAQEYVAYTSITESPRLYYWHREARNSNAEVDFLFTLNGKVIPTEVKSGKTGSLKSLHYFLESHPNSNFGIKLSELSYHKNATLVTVPFYAIEALLRPNSE